jgi:hypothetical protein
MILARCMRRNVGNAKELDHAPSAAKSTLFRYSYKINGSPRLRQRLTVSAILSTCQLRPKYEDITDKSTVPAIIQFPIIDKNSYAEVGNRLVRASGRLQDDDFESVIFVQLS